MDWEGQGDKVAEGHKAPEVPRSRGTQHPGSGTAQPALSQSRFQDTEAPPLARGLGQDLEWGSQVSLVAQRQDDPDRGWGQSPPLSPPLHLGEDTLLTLLEPELQRLPQVYLHFPPLPWKPAVRHHTRLDLKNL